MTGGVYAIKPWFLRRLRRVEEVLVQRGVSADALTLAAVGISSLGGMCLALGGLMDAPRLWLFLPPLCVVRLALNALDGSVARRAAPDPFGVVTNELGDRLQDAAMIAPLAFVASPMLALAALAATFVTSICGLLGSASGGDRLTTGPAGKADRVLLIGIGAGIAGVAGNAAPLEATTWLLLVGAALTIATRVSVLRRVLRGVSHVR